MYKQFLKVACTDTFESTAQKAHRTALVNRLQEMERHYS